MPITDRPIQNGGDDAYVKIFYDFTFVPTGTQTYMDAPLTNNTDPAFGPTGFCLLVVNTTGTRMVATVFSNTGAVLIDHINVPTGNPVTTGNARSRTAAQMAALGLTKRGDVGTVMFE